MRILFMGSGIIAGPTLHRLMDRTDLDVVGVVTQPDRPKGRGRKVQACPIKELSTALDLHVLDPEKVGAKAAVEELAALQPDLIVVAAYGQYIKPAILDMPPLGAINLHPSLLPKYRGAAPIQMAIANGETETGVTILYVSEQMDAGDMILQRTMPIGPDDTSATVLPRLAELGADMIGEAIDRIQAGTVHPVPQKEDDVIYVSKLNKSDGRIDWTMSAVEIRNRIRGFHPWPGTYCLLSEGGEDRLKVHWAETEAGSGRPGEVLELGKNGPLVATGSEALRLTRVQPPGKKTMDGAAFLRGHAMHIGDRLL